MCLISLKVYVEWKSYVFRQTHSELNLQGPGSGPGMVKKTGIATLLCVGIFMIQLYFRYSTKDGLKNESYILFKVKICIGYFVP